MRLFNVKRALASWPTIGRWITNLLVVCTVLLCILAFALVPLAENSSRLNARQVFESSRWNALQLQLQSYRLMNYLSDLSEADLPLNGSAYFQYDLVLSRIELLRKGQIGNHIKSFSNGRATRLLNIIAGELELISLNLEYLENGDLDQVPILMARLRTLDSQISDFVVIVNQGASSYITEQRNKLNQKLESLQTVALLLISVTALLILFSVKTSLNLRSVFVRNLALEKRIQDIQKEKTEIVANISKDLKPNLTSMIGHCSSAQTDSSSLVSQQLKYVKDISDLLLTQIDSYYDLSLIESKQLKTHISEGNLNAHIERSMNALNNLFDKYSITAVCCIDPRLPSKVETDFKRLHEITISLMSQLAEFSANSPMSIHIRPSTLPIIESSYSDTLRETKMVQISIRDYGKGLPGSVQTGLRSNPYNPENSIVNQVNSMGIGFTFCHHLVSLLGGELHFSSSTENGTEIWVDIPMTLMKASPLEATPMRQTGRSNIIFESRKILATSLKFCFEAIEEESTILNTKQLLLNLISFDSDASSPYTILITDESLLDQDIIAVLNSCYQKGTQIFCTSLIQNNYPELHYTDSLGSVITKTHLERLISS